MDPELPSLEQLSAELRQARKEIAELRTEFQRFRDMPRKRSALGGPYIVTSIVIAFWLLYWVYTHLSR